MYTKGLVFFVSNLVGTILGIIFLTLGLVLTKNKDYKTKLIPMKVLLYCLIICELIKIFYVIGKNPSGFNPKSYPIIYCSGVMYLLAICIYSKKDSLLNRMAKGAIIIPFLVMGILYHFIFPGLDTTSDLSGFILNVHSRTYHILAMYNAIYMIANKLYDFRFKDFLFVAGYSSLYFQFCTILSLFIGGEISNFGPASGELSWFYEKTGYATGNLLLGVVALMLGFVIYGTIELIRRKIKKKDKAKDLLENL